MRVNLEIFTADFLSHMELLSASSVSLSRHFILTLIHIIVHIVYRICRNKRPPKTVIFQRGEYIKPMAFDGWFFKGGSTQNRWALVDDFSKGGVHKTDGLWWVLECFLLLLKIRHPGRLFRQIRYIFVHIVCVVVDIIEHLTVHIVYIVAASLTKTLEIERVLLYNATFSYSKKIRKNRKSTVNMLRKKPGKKWQKWKRMVFVDHFCRSFHGTEIGKLLRLKIHNGILLGDFFVSI